jgi:hypothetical protein
MKYSSHPGRGRGFKAAEDLPAFLLIRLPVYPFSPFFSNTTFNY